MEKSWRARKMMPGHDTISVMAMHYGLEPSVVRDVIKTAGVEVIREDGFRGTVDMVKSVSSRRKVTGWSDGVPGVDPKTTKLTKAAIMAVARWKHEQNEIEAA